MSRALKHNKAIDLEPHAAVNRSAHQPPANKPDVPGARAGGVFAHRGREYHRNIPDGTESMGERPQAPARYVKLYTRL